MNLVKLVTIEDSEVVVNVAHVVSFDNHFGDRICIETVTGKYFWLSPNVYDLDMLTSLFKGYESEQGQRKA